jgi:type I restriction enzyme M protein
VHIGVNTDDYKTLLSGHPNTALLSHETFVQYLKKFDASTEIINLKKQKGFKTKSKTEQDAELDKRFLAFTQAIERDKLYYFVLVSTQPNPVLIIKSPTDTKAQKQLLGYDWSSAKGDEGIKLVKDAQDHHLTPLYDETNRDNPIKLNRCVADNFDGKLASVPAYLSNYATMDRLVDMLDFSRVTFEKQITLMVKKGALLQSKWPMVKLGELAEVSKGVTYSKSDQTESETSKVILTADNITLSGQFEIQKKIFLRNDFQISDSKQLKRNDIFICLASGSKKHVGKVALIPYDTEYFAGGFMGIIRAKKPIIPSVLFELLNTESSHERFSNESTGSNIQNLSSSILDIKIPLPPLDIQQLIVTECEAVDAEVDAAHIAIDAAQSKLITLAHDLRTFTLVPINEISINLDHKRVPVERNKRKPGPYPYYGASGIVDYVDTYLIDDVVLLISEDGANLKSRVTPIAFTAKGEIWVNNHAHILKFDNPRIHKLTELYINHLNISEYITGSAQPKLSQNNLNRIKVPVPKESDQKRLVEEIETLEQTIAAAQAIIAAAPTKKQAIMQRYL